MVVYELAEGRGCAPRLLVCSPGCPLAHKAGPGAATQPLPSAQQGSRALGCQSISQSMSEQAFTDAQGEAPSEQSQTSL